MYSKITQLRVRGVERPERDVNNDTGIFGAVQMVKVGGYLRMEVHEHGNHMPEAVLLPALWDAKCAGVRDNLMIWQGYQQHQLPEKKGNPVYFQEWRMEIIGDRLMDRPVRSLYETYNREADVRRAAGAAQDQPAPGQ